MGRPGKNESKNPLPSGIDGTVDNCGISMDPICANPRVSSGSYLPRTALGRRLMREVEDAERRGEQRLSLEDIAILMRRLRD